MLYKEAVGPWSLVEWPWCILLPQVDYVNLTTLQPEESTRGVKNKKRSFRFQHKKNYALLFNLSNHTSFVSETTKRM
jgi:hypothetical protein